MGMFDNLWEGLGNIARDPIKETQRFTDEKVANVGDVARGGGRLVSDLTTEGFGAFGGQKGKESAQKKGIFGGMTNLFDTLLSGTTEAIGSGFGSFFKGLGFDPIIIIAIIGIILLFIIIK